MQVLINKWKASQAMRHYFTYHIGKHNEDQTHEMLCSMWGNGDFVGLEVGGKFVRTYPNFKILFPSVEQFYFYVVMPWEILTHVQEESYTRVFNVYNSENWKDRNVHRRMYKQIMEHYVPVKKMEFHLYGPIWKCSMKSGSEKASFSLILGVCVHVCKVRSHWFKKLTQQNDNDLFVFMSVTVWKRVERMPTSLLLPLRSGNQQDRNSHLYSVLWRLRAHLWRRPSLREFILYYVCN